MAQKTTPPMSNKRPHPSTLTLSQFGGSFPQTTPAGVAIDGNNRVDDLTIAMLSASSTLTMPPPPPQQRPQTDDDSDDGTINTINTTGAVASVTTTATFLSAPFAKSTLDEDQLSITSDEQDEMDDESSSSDDDDDSSLDTAPLKNTSKGGGEKKKNNKKSDVDLLKDYDEDGNLIKSAPLMTKNETKAPALPPGS